LRPLISPAAFRTWLAAEGERQLARDVPASFLIFTAARLRTLGVQNLGALPVARSAHGWVNMQQIIAMASTLSEIILVAPAHLPWSASYGFKPVSEEETRSLHLAPNVLAPRSDIYTGKLFLSEIGSFGWPGPLTAPWKDDVDPYVARNLEGAALEALATAWHIPFPTLARQARRNIDAGDDETRRTIGTWRGKPYRCQVVVLKR
jgi:hypothetical protein